MYLAPRISEKKTAVTATAIKPAKPGLDITCSAMFSAATEAITAKTQLQNPVFFAPSNFAAIITGITVSTTTAKIKIIKLMDYLYSFICITLNSKIQAFSLPEYFAMSGYSFSTRKLLFFDHFQQ
jgi:hypothetical protein